MATGLSWWRSVVAAWPTAAPAIPKPPEGERVDGGIFPDDGAVLGTAWGIDDAGFKGNDDNNRVDDGEIPCLCAGDARSCREILNEGGGITVPGACLDQIDRNAPCETACAGIINFDPVPVGQ